MIINEYGNGAFKFFVRGIIAWDDPYALFYIEDDIFGDLIYETPMSLTLCHDMDFGEYTKYSPSGGLTKLFSAYLSDGFGWMDYRIDCSGLYLILDKNDLSFTFPVDMDKEVKTYPHQGQTNF